MTDDYGAQDPPPGESWVFVARRMDVGTYVWMWQGEISLVDEPTLTWLIRQLMQGEPP